MVFVRYMRLRGFKSIGATRTVQIDFDKGFSAIVGANGSGKSNILEAFSFVMGQLSAKSLRGENMRNMIFSGNQKAGIPPAKEAWVELVLDNADRGLPIDSDIVKISRSIDVDGKGKYKINGTTTTRTEIQDLLAMGGMHSNSYSMVLQGSVYEVVNMTKLERRKLIEDIAGISAYDEKKAAAQKELDVVEGNLSQVRLLLNEVSMQLSELEKEKDDALRYQQLARTLERATIALKIADIEATRADIASATEAVAGLRTRIAEVAGTIDGNRASMEEIGATLREIHRELAEKQGTDLLKLNAELDDAKQGLADATSGLKYLAESGKKARDDKTRTEDDIQRLESEREQLVTDLDALRKEATTLEAALVTRREDVAGKLATLASHDERFQALVRAREQARHDMLDARQALNEATSELKLAETYLQNDRKAVATIEGELDRLASSKDAITRDAQAARAAMGKATRDGPASPDEVQARIKSIESDLRVTRDIVRKKSEEIYEIRSTIKAMQHAGSGGIARTLSTLLEAKRQGTIKGIHDTIGNLGKVDATYAVAMDIAAGGKTNYVVVDDRDVATACIKFLKAQNAGRLSFIPLDKIRTGDVPRDQDMTGGVHGRAVDLIDFDPKYVAAFEFIFGRTFIVDDLEVAKRFAPSYRRVTLDGDVVDPSNLMTGGSHGKTNAGNAFQSKDAAKLPGLEQEIEGLKEKERTLERKVRECQASISEYYTAKITAEKENSRVREQVAKLEARLEEIETSREGLERKLEATRAGIGAGVAKREALLGTIDSRDKAVQAVQAELARIEDELASSPHAGLKQDIERAEKDVKDIEARRNKLEVTLAQRATRLEDHVERALGEHRTRVGTLAATIADLDARVAAGETEKARLKTTINDIEARIAIKNEELKGLLEQKRALDKRREELGMAVQHLTLEHQALELKLGNQNTRIHDLKATLAQLEAEVPEDASVPESFVLKPRAELVAEIDACKRGIDAMGNVNMMAIEKYNDNKARFDDLTAKHDVLVTERESILEFMASVEKQKKGAFLQTYHSIARNFAYIFSRLSPGGEAKLELENMEDPFSGGVLIMARPAGKPLNEISLLSGGERSLTSLSLIFAIQQHSPSPLYILDEIDAALDDANAALVAGLIRELSDRSQFIIVTHRDVTMTRVDQILGVSNVDGVTDVMALKLGELSKIAMEADA